MSNSTKSETVLKCSRGRVVLAADEVPPSCWPSRGKALCSLNDLGVRFLRECSIPWDRRLERLLTVPLMPSVAGFLGG
ncbi:unnamed protein product [Arctogadus glacialis]